MHRIQAAYIPVSPRQPKCPAAADTPGWMRWSPEDGEGGLRRVLLPRPLVRRKATIKSTEAMRYSSLKKPEETPKAKRRYLIKTEGNQQTASQTSRKCPRAIGTSPDNQPTASQPSPTPVAKIKRASSPSSDRPPPWRCACRPRCRRPRRRREPVSGRTAQPERPDPPRRR